MERLINLWKENFFTEISLLFILIICLIISFKRRKQFSLLKYFPVYLAAFTSLIINDYLLNTILYNSEYFRLYTKYGDGILNLFVTTIEFLVLTNIIYRATITLRNKKIIIFTSSITLLLYILQIFNIQIQNKISFLSILHQIYIIESCSLIIITTIYFIELYKSPPESNYSTIPAFWIACGLMFYLIGTLPMTIVTNYIFQTNIHLYKNLFALIYVFYCMFFLMVIKAYYAGNRK